MFFSCKDDKFSDDFILIFAQNYRLWVQVKTQSVLCQKQLKNKTKQIFVPEPVENTDFPRCD